MSYNPKSCSALQKSYYTPIEAALRWCGLIDHESEILLACANSPKAVPVNAFPQWPCLRANVEIIYDELTKGDLQKSRDGNPVPKEEQVTPVKLTVRHNDLKAWMEKHRPDQKPAFLFDEIERNTHAAMNAGTFLALQADRDALQARIEKAETCYRDIMYERNHLRAMLDKSASLKPDNHDPLNPRAETTYLNIIGGLLGVILGKTPQGRKYSTFESQAAVIQVLLAHYQDTPGISQRTLEEKFSAANNSIKSL